MDIRIDPEQFRFRPGESASVQDQATQIEPLYDSKKEYRKMLKEYVEEIHDLHGLMYAHNRYSLLLIFQGMDTAGKDGAIRHVMSGVNPAGVQVFSFKKPSSEELDHDWMWRTSKCLPERGRIGIFNRSYYEEVLVVRVHPEIATKYQRIPPEFIPEDLDKLFDQRYEDIVQFEDYLYRNGTHVIKFFLHISKEEQRQRLLSRIDRPEKNWKMSLADVEERSYWDDYEDAFQKMLEGTSRKNLPWYVIPGDDKKNARLIISQIILNHLNALDMHYPKVDDAFRDKLQEVRKRLENE